LQALKDLETELGTEKLIVLEYHTHDRWALPETEALYKAYDAQGTPSVYFNGGNYVEGGGDYDYLYARYTRIINRELVVEDAVSITASKPPGGSGGTVAVSIANGSGGSLESSTLWLVAYQDLGYERHYHMVSEVESVPLAAVTPGQSIETSFSLDTAASGLNLAVFVKSSSGRVLQAVLLPGSPHIWLP
jgi:hypothetical protein